MPVDIDLTAAKDSEIDNLFNRLLPGRIYVKDRVYACFRMTWAEDRALLRSNPSADPRAKTGDRGQPSALVSLIQVSGIGTKAINLRGRMPRNLRQDVTPNSLMPTGKYSSSR